MPFPPSSLSIPLALASLFCGACSDITFKLYAKRSRAIGTYIAAVGVVWIVVFGLVGKATGSLANTSSTWLWGIVSGGFGAIANLLLVESMRKMDVGTCATIYRLNLVPAVVLAIIFLGEPPQWTTLAGILTAAGAVLAMQDQPSDFWSRAPVAWRNIPWLMVLACFLRAGMGVSYKAGIQTGATPCMLLAINGGMWVICGLGWFLARFERRQTDDAHSVQGRQVLMLAGASGLLTCGIVGFLMMALQRGTASVVLPISQLSFVLTAGIGFVAFKEPFTARKGFGIGLAVACVLILAITA